MHPPTTQTNADMQYYPAKHRRYSCLQSDCHDLTRGFSPRVSRTSFSRKGRPEIPSQTIKRWVKIYWSSHKNYFIMAQTLAFRTSRTTDPIKTEPDVL